jgi:hypothetical protein
MDKFVRPNIWIKDYKKMINADRINYDVKTVEVDLSQGDFYEFNFNEIVFLRPTYLKDSNGEYIYENDIIRWTSGQIDKVSGEYPTERYIVVFNFGRFIAVSEEKPYCIEELSSFMNIDNKERVTIEKNIHGTDVKLPKNFFNEEVYIEPTQ